MNDSSSRFVPNYASEIAVFAILLAAFLGAVAFVNVRYGAPDRLSPNDYAQLMVQGMLQGKSYSSVENERSVIRAYIDLMPSAPDVAVLGTSRTLAMSQALFPGNNFVNLSVSNSTLEDSVAAYGLLRQAGKLPKLVIISFEDWAFNANARLAYWKELEDAYRTEARRLGLTHHFDPCNEPWKVFGSRALCLDVFDELAATLSMSSFQSGLKDMLKGRDLARIVDSHSVSNVDVSGWLPDRSYNYRYKPAPYREDNIARFKREGFMFEKFNYIYYEDFKELDPLALNDTKTFIAAMLADRVKVVLFFPPVHPDSYKHYNELRLGDLALETERRLRAIASELNIPVVGSLNPASCDPDLSQYVDALHLRINGMTACFSRYLPQIRAIISD